MAGNLFSRTTEVYINTIKTGLLGNLSGFSEFFRMLLMQWEKRRQRRLAKNTLTGIRARAPNR
jgi:hypothetical protein